MEYCLNDFVPKLNLIRETEYSSIACIAREWELALYGCVARRLGVSSAHQVVFVRDNLNRESMGTPTNLVD